MSPTTAASSWLSASLEPRAARTQGVASVTPSM